MKYLVLLLLSGCSTMPYYADTQSIHQDVVEVNKQAEKYQTDPNSLRKSDINALSERCNGLARVGQGQEYPQPDTFIYPFYKANINCEKVEMLL